ncbi:MAG TPA: TonB family protein [Thermoanaerobaculia bacterium]|nr:TonB family protein [Thermoanaerobaculia bacterium]
MDLQSNLIESKKNSQRGGWKASLTSLGLHGILVAGIILIGATSTHRVNAEDKPIHAYISQTAAPPPPPPPPPLAASSSAPKATPHIQPVQPEPAHNAFIPPHEIPKDVPKVAEMTPQPSTKDDGKATDDLPSSAPTPAVTGGVAGGVSGGVEGGVVGGQVGGVIGGQVGGVAGGVIGGTGKDVNAEPKPEPAPEPKPEIPSGPVRVGGDVKAPVAIEHTDPKYTDTARTARVAGVVILEAIIDKSGHVDQVKVLKGLPMGLSDEAERAVRSWRFKPGTMNGQPVDVIFDLTVNFKLQ